MGTRVVLGTLDYSSEYAELREYVDDSVLKCKWNRAEEILNHLNEQEPEINFTKEEEEDNMISLKAYNQLETSYKWYSRDMNGKTHCVCHFHDIHRGSRQKTRLVGGKLIFNISNDNDVFYFQKKYWFCHGLRYLAMVLPTPHWNHWKMSKQDYS